MDDYSNNFLSISGHLKNAEERPLKEFVTTLTPRFFIVWRDILFGYCGLAIGVLLSFIVAHSSSLFGQILLSVPISILFGAFFFFLGNFLHEAAHYNLAASKKQSDRLANLFIGVLLCQDIHRYRPIHWEHHRKLGTTEDTENSYFNALSFSFIIKMLTGVHLIKTMLDRDKNISEKTADKKKLSYFSYISVIGMLMHICIVLSCLYIGNYTLAFAWTGGFIFVFPFLGALRQLLEHRSENADLQADYTQINHGAISRVFRKSLGSSFLGSAGFRNHLFHHWLPQVSYTRLDDLHVFLKETELKDVIEKRTTTYYDTFLILFRKANNI